MAFMELQHTQKGSLVSAECGSCGQTHHAHEFAAYDFNGDRDAMKDGTARCLECGGKIDPSTFWESPSRNYYAARYSANGYLDCTEWQYGKNLRKLLREVRDLFGGND